MSDEPGTPTPKEEQVYLYLYGQARDEGFQPSCAEMAEHFGYKGDYWIRSILANLAKKRWIVVPHAGARAVRFLRRPDGTKFLGFRDK